MSGEQLRNFTVLANHHMITSLLKGGANPCSRDEQSLTALHYAVFNGHLEATKILCHNAEGRDEEGRAVSARDLVTDSGLGLLHLGVMFDPKHYSEAKLDDKIEIVKYLLHCGQDPDQLDDLERTPKEIADSGDYNNDVVANLLEVNASDPYPVSEVLNFLETEGEIYDLHYVKREINLEYCAIDPITKERIITREDKLPIPPGQKLPEGHIFPSAQKHYKALRQDGRQAIRGLVEATKESELNTQRRELLANSVEYELKRAGKMNNGF
jgi:hypothetical protein